VRNLFAIILAATLLVLLSSLPALADCRPTSFTLETDWYGGVYVPAGIGGQPMKLLVDTGGATSMLTDSTVASLGLPRLPIRAARITMYGGLHIDSFVRVDGVQVGGIAAAPATFYVLPDSRIPYALSGTIAPDFLSRYDVEFDFPNARMNLYAPGCAAVNPRAALPVTADNVRHVIVPVQVDGRTVMAMLDTGASRSDFSLEAAQQMFGPGMNAGLRPACGADVEDGLYTHPFRTLSIGGVTVANPDLVLVPNQISRRPLNAPRLVLGMGVLRRTHMVIAYSRNLLQLSPR
jgi:predicted aspartyl protease